MIRDDIEEEHVPEEDPLYEEDQEGNDNILDDDYIVQLHKYLQEKKMQRIQAEKDANLLDCRLRCLKEQEENRSKEKANNTKEERAANTGRGVKKKDGVHEEERNRIREEKRTK